MSRIKIGLCLVLIACIALVGCGSKEKKNILGSGASASAAAKSQAASTQTEIATTQGLSALQSVFKSLNGQGQRGGAPGLNTVEYEWNWGNKDANGYYGNKSKDHRGSTMVSKMKPDPDIWDNQYYMLGSPWKDKNLGDEVRNGWISLIEYDAPADSIKASATERTYWVSKLTGTPPYLWPDWNSQRIETEGEGRTDNSKDGTWMTFTHKGTGKWGGTFENIYNSTGMSVGSKWTWGTENTDKMDFVLSTGYTGTFDTTIKQIYSFSNKWDPTNYKSDSSTSIWDVSLITDGKLYKDNERIASVHIEARNVVDGMRVEGYYTIPSENDAIKHDVNSEKFGFISTDMFRKKTSMY